jgi:hypothetical protein
MGKHYLQLNVNYLFHLFIQFNFHCLEKDASTYAYEATTTSTKPRRFPCKYGRECRSTKDPQHLAKYSHPT